MGRYPTVPHVEMIAPEKTNTQDRMNAVADEISQNLANSIGSIEESDNKADANKFSTLQFGPGYNPTK